MFNTGESKKNNKVVGQLTEIISEEKITDNLYRLTAIIGDFDSYTLFGKMEDYIELINELVEFEIRPDIVNGLVTDVIYSIAKKNIIQVVEDFSEEDSDKALIAKKSSYINVITFDSTKLKDKDIALGQIVLVSDYAVGKSKHADWIDFTCLDINSNSFNLRLFSNQDFKKEFAKECVGKYVTVDIKKEGQYGLKVYDNMSVVDGLEVQLSPEVYIAASKLSLLLMSDKQLSAYVNKYSLLEKLKGIIYYEPGYHLVEMAAELMMINTACKIFAEYDLKLLRRTIFTSRGYLLNNHKSLSNPIVNYHRVITSELKDDLKLLKMLDVTNEIEEGDINKTLYYSIRRTITTIMKGRRDIHETLSISSLLNNLNNEYNGLF